ncbi:hypothetical protein [Paraburkholderia oxyphila]|uniref:hypothetical protein n=1 Tax=Paraburkholderia oxyphila TaxID=614212 RepID=UPI0009FD438C|nr:hypothetical protein [Paraburkholderia oxyphila]
MRIDPIRSNFYQGTGAYAWQLAEYLQHNHADEDGRYQLSKAVPPVLPSPATIHPEFLAADTVVRWSKAVRITHNAPQIIGARGVRSSLVVVESTQAFAGIRHRDAIALEEGVTAGSMSDIEINGKIYNARKLLVTLRRHGFIETDRKPTLSSATHYMIEPTCFLIETPGIGNIAINQLNGRMIRLSATSNNIFDHSNHPYKMPKSPPSSVDQFIEAGMLRVVSMENPIEND